MEIYRDVGKIIEAFLYNNHNFFFALYILKFILFADYSNIYSNQPKSTTQTPQTFAPKPQTQSTSYLTQTPAPKQKYNQQQNIYSSSDYDEALVAQVN